MNAGHAPPAVAGPILRPANFRSRSEPAGFAETSYARRLSLKGFGVGVSAGPLGAALMPDPAWPAVSPPEGLVSGPHGGDLVGVELAEVVSHHQ
jgi:hypothetical protein